MYQEFYRDRIEAFTEDGQDLNYNENMYMLYKYLQQFSGIILFSENYNTLLNHNHESNWGYSFSMKYARLDIDGEKVSAEGEAQIGLIMKHAEKLPSCKHAVFAADYSILADRPSLVLAKNPDGTPCLVSTERVLSPAVEFFSGPDGNIPEEIEIGSYMQGEDLTNRFSCSKRGETTVHKDMENFSEGLGKVGSVKKWYAELSALGVSFSRAAAGDRFEEIRQKFNDFDARYFGDDIWYDQVDEEGDLIEGCGGTETDLTEETLPVFLKELEELCRLISEAAPGGTLTLDGYIFSEDPEHPMDVIRVETDEDGTFCCYSASL